MKGVIGVALLSALTVSLGGGSVSAQSDRPEFESFSDWCRNREQLTPEARHTVEVLLREARTQNCDRAEDRLTSLTELNLIGHQISDVTPLANLINLSKLGLAGHQISDVTALAHLTHLDVLNLNDNQISDVTPLANLTHLTQLWLYGNQISDVTPLANLTNLAVLRLDGNPLEDRTCPVQPETICWFE